MVYVRTKRNWSSIFKILCLIFHIPMTSAGVGLFPSLYVDHATPLTHQQTSLACLSRSQHSPQTSTVHKSVDNDYGVTRGHWSQLWQLTRPDMCNGNVCGPQLAGIGGKQLHIFTDRHHERPSLRQGYHITRQNSFISRRPCKSGLWLGGGSSLLWWPASQSHISYHANRGGRHDWHDVGGTGNLSRKKAEKGMLCVYT